MRKKNNSFFLKYNKRKKVKTVNKIKYHVELNTQYNQLFISNSESYRAR